MYDRETPMRLRSERVLALEAGNRLQTYGSARRCAHPDCRSRLSRYNPDGTCNKHGGWGRARATQRQA